jgi:hypothetical protein
VHKLPNLWATAVQHKLWGQLQAADTANRGKGRVHCLCITGSAAEVVHTVDRVVGAPRIDIEVR